MRMQQCRPPQPNRKKIQKISLSGKNSWKLHFPLHQLTENLFYFLLNVSGSPRIAAFSSTLTGEIWNLGCPRTAAFSSSLIAKKLEPFFLALFNHFFYTQLAFVFHFPKDSYNICNNILVFCFFLLQKDFDTFCKPLFEAFIFFDNIQSAFLYI